MDFFADVILRSAFAPNPAIGGFTELLSQQQVTGGDVNANTDGFVGASSSRSYELSYVTDDHNDGEGCIKLLNTYTGLNTIIVDLEYASGNLYWPVSVGNSYTFKFNIKSNVVGSNDCKARIRWVNSSHSFILNNDGNITNSPTSWTEKTVTATAPANAAYAVIRVNATKNTNQYILIDTCSFKRSS